MSLTPTAPRFVGNGDSGASRTYDGTGRRRRVRHQMLDVLAVMAFSASASVVVATGLLVLTQLGR
jgi:hypothetical protein